MVVGVFKEICHKLANEQDQTKLLDTTLQLTAEVHAGKGKVQLGSLGAASLNVPTRPDMPQFAKGKAREKGMNAAHAIEDYIVMLQERGMHAEAAVIGTMYTELVKQALMKPRIRSASEKLLAIPVVHSSLVNGQHGLATITPALA